MSKTMVQTRNATEASLAIRAAWLHYVGKLTQAEVAKKVSSKANNKIRAYSFWAAVPARPVTSSATKRR